MINDAMHVLLIFATIVMEADATTKVSTYLREFHIKHRYKIGEKTWPPKQPSFYIPQSLLYHEGQYEGKEESDLMVELIQMGGNYLNHQPLQHILDRSKNTKETKRITEIFYRLDAHEDSKFLLIEGAQGMGKTILLQEIAYRWANNKLLTTCKFVFLIRLQDPKVHEVKTLSGFLQYFCEKSGFPKKVVKSAFSRSDNFSGKNVAFILDSLEEFPAHLQEDSFVFKVLRREVLHDCVLVVSSRPHVSAWLRPQATVRVYLLGFTEMEQKKEFIEQALEDKQENREVTQYIECESTINSLCLVPLYMTILLYMYRFNHALFSSELIGLYNKFLCLIICRYLAKHNHSFENTTYNLKNLPAPCDKIITKLCKLSLENLIVFTYDQIKETCPEILETPGSINGLDLFQAVQCDCMTGRTIKFSFSHCIIREILVSRHNYVPDSQLKFHLFKTGFKAENKEMYKDIINTNIFDDRTINLRGISLSQLPSDVEYLARNLIQLPHQEWEEVDIHGCDIKDCGIAILHEGLKNHSMIIKRLSLSCNNLTESSSSKIHDIVINCAVKVLAIRHNPAIGNDTDFFSKLLSDPNSRLEELYMSNSNCTPSGTITNMFSALEGNKKLKVLQTINNNITNDDCGAIVRALRRNTSLVVLNMSGNQINANNAKRIIQSLTNNKTLKYLALPWYKPKHQKDIAKLAKKVYKKSHCGLKAVLSSALSGIQLK